MSASTELPEWENVLSSAARLQTILPEAVLVGGTASAIHAGHRFSRDADHVLTDLRERFSVVLGQLESVAGWKTARVKSPVMILGSLDGIETGVRQLIREQKLETTVMTIGGHQITLPTKTEILRIKGILILKRNATRDYLDFIALASLIGEERTALALQNFDTLYPQPNGESALQQLQAQLSHAMPFDLDAMHLSEYRNLGPQWHDWNKVQGACAHMASVVFDRICDISEQ